MFRFDQGEKISNISRVFPAFKAKKTTFKDKWRERGKAAGLGGKSKIRQYETVETNI